MCRSDTPIWYRKKTKIRVATVSQCVQDNSIPLSSLVNYKIGTELDLREVSQRITDLLA